MHGDVTLRSLALVSLLAALAIGGYLFVAQTDETGSASGLARQAEADASAGAAATSLQAAAPILQAYFTERGTYAGATLPPSYGVVVANTGPTSYCLEAADGSRHVVGPAGTPARGRCQAPN